MTTVSRFLLLLLALLPMAERLEGQITTNSLRDDLNGEEIGGRVRNLVVCIHGWNSTLATDHLPDEWSKLVKQLRIALTTKSPEPWHLLLYDWEKDADTGVWRDFADYDGWLRFVVPQATKAANNAAAHGESLGRRLPNSLRRVHFIAHSAGAWCARKAADWLLETNPYVVVQVTLLDPYIPDEIAGYENPLSKKEMEKLASLPARDRMYTLDNYYSVDTVSDGWDCAQSLFPTYGTQSEFEWGNVRFSNTRVDWPRPADGDNPPGCIPWLSHYKWHSGPIVFYSDTVQFATYPMLGTPNGLSPDLLLIPPFDPAGVGWFRSIFGAQSEMPRIVTQPRPLQSAPIGSNVTLSVRAIRAKEFQWFRNGTPVAGNRDNYTFQLDNDSAGEYVVRVADRHSAIFSDVAMVNLSSPVDEIYTVNSTAGPNGSIALDGITAHKAGSSLSITALPEVGYTVDKWTIDGTLAQNGGEVLLIPNLLRSITVAVSFRRLPAVELRSLSITGPEVVLGNSSTRFLANALFDDGSTVSVPAQWNVDASIGSFTQDGVLRVGNLPNFSAFTVVAAYSHLGTRKTAFLTVIVHSEDDQLFDLSETSFSTSAMTGVRLVRIINRGNSRLNWSAALGVNWISIIPNSGVVEAGGDAVIQVQVSRNRGDTRKAIVHLYNQENASQSREITISQESSIAVAGVFRDTFPGQAFSGRRSISGDASTATAEQGEGQHAGVNPRSSIWARWFSDTKGRIRVTTEGSSFPTVLSVYQASGTLSGLSELASDVSRIDRPWAELTVDVQLSQVIDIVIDTLNGSTGAAILTLSDVPELKIVSPGFSGGSVGVIGKRYVGEAIWLSGVPGPGNVFSGWMQDGRIISTEPAFRLQLNGTEAILPIFSRADLTSTLSASRGLGEFVHVNAAVSAPTIVALHSGDSLNHWTARELVAVEDTYRTSVRAVGSSGYYALEVPVRGRQLSRTLTGRVLNLDDTPVSDAVVRIPGVPNPPTASDANGHFVIEDIPKANGLLQVEASKDTYSFEVKEIDFASLEPIRITGSIVKFAVEALVEPAAAGSVVGLDDYVTNSLVKLKAVPAIGFYFVRWREGEEVVQKDADYSFTATRPRHLIAEFSAVETLGSGLVDCANLVSNGSTIYVTDRFNEVIRLGAMDVGSSEFSWLKLRPQGELEQYPRVVRSIFPTASRVFLDYGGGDRFALAEVLVDGGLVGRLVTKNGQIFGTVVDGSLIKTYYTQDIDQTLRGVFLQFDLGRFSDFVAPGSLSGVVYGNDLFFIKDAEGDHGIVQFTPSPRKSRLIAHTSSLQAAIVPVADARYRAYFVEYGANSNGGLRAAEYDGSIHVVEDALGVEPVLCSDGTNIFFVGRDATMGLSLLKSSIKDPAVRPVCPVGKVPTKVARAGKWLFWLEPELDGTVAIRRLPVID